KGPGSYAKSLVSNEVRLETVDHDAHLLGSFETDTLIRWLVLLNFGPDAPIPKSIYDATDAPDRDQRMKGIATSLKDGVSVPLGYYRMTMRVPEPMEGEPVVATPTVAPHPPTPSPIPSPQPGEGEQKATTPRQPAQAVAPLSRRLGGDGRGVGGEVPYLVWWTVADDRVRQRPLHNHAVMHGKVFAVDHPIWKTWWPPAGHNCRCFIGTIPAAEAQALGYTGPEPTGPWPL